MEKKKSKWLLGCGIGCAVVIFLGLAGMTAGGLYFGGLIRKFDEAIAVREEVEERFGGPSDYRPAPDGAVAPERMQAFLAIRQALEPTCVKFEDTFGRLDELDGKEDVSAGEMFSIFKTAWSIAPLMSEFFRTRNQALLDAEMGMGEYTYLFVLAYRTLPAIEAAHDPEAEPIGALDGRVRRAFAGFLRAQARAAREAGAGDEAIAAIEAEASALDDEAGRLPWEDGLPEAIAASLEPYRERLAPLDCPHSQGAELARSKRGRLSITTD